MASISSCACWPSGSRSRPGPWGLTAFVTAGRLAPGVCKCEPTLRPEPSPSPTELVVCVQKNQLLILQTPFQQRTPTRLEAEPLGWGAAGVRSLRFSEARFPGTVKHIGYSETPLVLTRRFSPLTPHVCTAVNRQLTLPQDKPCLAGGGCKDRHPSHLAASKPELFSLGPGKATLCVSPGPAW